ncbi:MAG: endonuclease MutS2, partial [Pseudobdellovibrionaceae bacterium]
MQESNSISLQRVDWQNILDEIKNNATSFAGREKIQKLRPLSSPQEAQKSIDEVAEGFQILITGQRPFMESLDLFAPWFTRLKIKSTLKTLELKDVRHFCLETIALKEIIGPFNGPYCSYLKNTLMTAEEPLSAIEQILAPNGDIRMDASEKLYSLSKEKENLARQVQNTLDRLVHDHEMVTFIQDKYVTTREGRWVLP